MEEKDKNKPEENFSDDPEANLRIENEILKLKMQAESGAFFGGGENIAPEIENDFLLHVQQFEEAWKDVKYVKVYDLIGRPAFKKAEELSASEVEAELKKLLDLLDNQNIHLEVLGEYEPIIIYRFITEELFEHETDDIQLPGMTKNFIYEEFHPNHKMDIEENGRKFLKHWFGRSFDEYSWELSNTFILGDGTVVSKQKVLKKMNDVFASYTSFNNCKYAIADISFQWNEQEGNGMGHAEGGVKYDGVTESGETIQMEGPFKLYLANEYGAWSIFYFVFPGFAW